MKYNWPQLKSEIKKETKRMLAGKVHHALDEVLDTFYEFLRFPVNDSAIHLDGLETRVPNALQKIVEGLPKTDIHSYLIDLARVEPFLRKLLYLIDPIKFNQLSSQKKG